MRFADVNSTSGEEWISEYAISETQYNLYRLVQQQGHPGLIEHLYCTWQKMHDATCPDEPVRLVMPVSPIPQRELDAVTYRFIDALLKRTKPTHNATERRALFIIYHLTMRPYTEEK